MNHVVDHSKNSGSVAYHKLVEGPAVSLLGPFYQVQFGDIRLSYRRFRLHIWTEAGGFNSFNPENLRSRSAGATHSGIPRLARSEERRVGKECRSRWTGDQQ